jgi:hypothetical protein
MVAAWSDPQVNLKPNQHEVMAMIDLMLDYWLDYLDLGFVWLWEPMLNVVFDDKAVGDLVIVIPVDGVVEIVAVVVVAAAVVVVVVVDLDV